MTRALSPLFDAAIKKETSTNFNFPEQNRVGRTNNGNLGLPQGPRGNFALRKPPSLSTLAMPTFSGIPPPSTSLVADIKSLISKLPQENHDLLRTVIDLIKATGKESKKTKMPLSNLLLVFCPSLNMTPPLLKVFCEAADIWVGGSEEAEVIDSPPPPLPTKDGQFALAKEDEAEMSDASEEIEDEEEDRLEETSLMSSERASLDDPSSGYHASEEEEASPFEEGQAVRRRVPMRNTERSEIPTVYLDTRSHYSSSSASSLHECLEPSGRYHHNMNSRDDMVIADDDRSISSSSHPIPPISTPSPPLCSSSVESVASPTSEASSSFSQLPVWDGGCEKKPVEIVDPDSMPFLSPTITTTPTKKTIVSRPVPPNDGDVPFPQLPNTPSARRAKRMSIPLLSLPNFSPPFLLSSDVDRLKDDDLPSPSPTSASGVNMLNKRSKRPSLRLLFSGNKKSTSSLSGGGDRSGGGGDGMSFISNPISQHHPQDSPAWESGTSDSSDSTPLSAVTALTSRSGLPPVLDTPIEDSSLSFDLGFDGPPEMAMPSIKDESLSDQQKLEKDVASPTPTVTPASMTFTLATTESPGLAPPQTPIANRISKVSTEPPPSPTIGFSISHPPSLPEQHQSSSVSIPHRPSLSLETQSLDSEVSISSEASLQLSLLDDGEEDGEDWTKSVLSAADRML